MTTKSVSAAIQERRSIRRVKKDPNVTKEQMEQLLQKAVYAPSAFNMQSGRMVLVMDEDNEKLWSIVEEELRKVVPAEDFSATEERLAGYRNGNGTILFFEDDATLEQMRQNAPLYADSFINWSDEGTGILQYATWLLLEEAGLGASIQHYNPLIDEKVAAEWDIPKEWRLIAQIPFGAKDEEAAKREFLPFEDVVKVIK
ncbi:nitroreductase family protein [Savagea faecisuis]|uniref:Nitroreductase family protein n=1 Tax=Savagea faecisuis TaxID=1274803 RepID=A0ABW3GUW3_9BACL